MLIKITIETVSKPRRILIFDSNEINVLEFTSISDQQAALTIILKNNEKLTVSARDYNNGKSIIVFLTNNSMDEEKLNPLDLELQYLIYKLEKY